MKVFVIGGANVDITATSAHVFRLGDSNPGRVHISWGGVGRNIAHNLALLGDSVELVTIFGGGLFAPLIEKECRETGIGTAYCRIAPEGTNSFFVSLNNSDGEMLGGVADMNATDGMDAKWLSERMEAINGADAVVADANLQPEALSFLIDNCRPPLYLDAVSAAKAPRIAVAMELSRKKHVFALKCNALENDIISNVPGIDRLYESVGAEGLKVLAGGKIYEFPALPCIVRNTTGGGDALLAGIVHAGPEAGVEKSSRWGLLCARAAVECQEAVNKDIKYLKYE